METRKARSIAVPEKAKENGLDYLSQYSYRNVDMDADELDTENPPVPLRSFIIQPAILVEGVRFCNNLIAIRTSNEVHFHHKTGAMQYVSQQDMNEYIDRNDPRVKIPAVIPNMANTDLCVQVSNDLLVDGRTFREKYPQFVPGMDEKVLQAIESGRLDVYVVPFHYMRDTQDRRWTTFSFGLHRFTKDMREKTISCNVSNRFEPFQDSSRMFHGLTGTSDRTSAEIESAFFGQMPALNGNQRGWIVVMYVGTVQLSYTSLLTAHSDGTMDNNFHRSGIVFPDIAFKREDEADRRRNRNPKTRRRDRNERKSETAEGAPPNADGTANDTGDENEAAPVARRSSGLGDFSDMFPPSADDDDASDDGSDANDPPANT